MKLKIPFNELKDAIEQASYEHHYLIDQKNHKIIFISEYEEDYKHELEEVDNGNFIGIEPRMPEDDFRIMESFVYEIQEKDFELNVPSENMLTEKEIKRIMKEMYQIDDYGCIDGGDKEILTSSECQKCKSSEVFEDF